MRTCKRSCRQHIYLPAKAAVDSTQTFQERSSGMNATSGELVTVLSARVEENEWGVPELLRWLYQTEEHEPIATSQNMLGIISYVNGSPRQQYLTFFMRACRTDAVDATFRVAPLNGGVYDASHPTDEANMDIQYAGAMVFPTLVLFSCSSSYSSSSGDVTFSPTFPASCTCGIAPILCKQYTRQP